MNNLGCFLCLLYNLGISINIVGRRIDTFLHNMETAIKIDTEKGFFLIKKTVF